MLCIAILRVFFQHLLLLSLIRVNFVVLGQDVVLHIRSVLLLDCWLEAWWNVLGELVSWDPSLSGSALNLQLLLLRSAYLGILRDILALLRHLFALLAHSPVVILFLLLWLRAHLRRLRIITSWASGVLGHLCRLPRLVVLVDVPVAQDFLVIWIVLMLIKLALVSRGSYLLLLLASVVPTAIQFTQVVDRVAPWIARVLLWALAALVDKVILLLKVARRLRSWLVWARALCWDDVSRLGASALWLLEILSWALFARIIFIGRLAWIVSIVIISVLNHLIWIRRSLRDLCCVSLSRVNRVCLSSTPCIPHLRLTWLWLSCSSKTGWLCGRCQLLFWTIFLCTALKIIILIILIHIPL